MRNNSVMAAKQLQNAQKQRKALDKRRSSKISTTTNDNPNIVFSNEASKDRIGRPSNAGKSGSRENGRTQNKHQKAKTTLIQNDNSSQRCYDRGSPQLAHSIEDRQQFRTLINPDEKNNQRIPVQRFKQNYGSQSGGNFSVPIASPETSLLMNRKFQNSSAETKLAKIQATVPVGTAVPDTIAAAMFVQENPSAMMQQTNNQPTILQSICDRIEHNGNDGGNIEEIDSLQDNLQDRYFLQQNLLINEEAALPVAGVLLDEDDFAGKINNYGKTVALDHKRRSRNDARKSVINSSPPKGSSKAVGSSSRPYVELDQDGEELDESARDTRILVAAGRPRAAGLIGRDGSSPVIGDYKIEKTLGQGTFGKVKQGYHIHTGQKVAIKILDKWKIEDTNDIERVAREIHILKIVRHPHIIQLYEIIETPKRLFLIMEHCCNGELFNYITSKNRLKEDEACRLFQQLISGIEYLGELGIAHRDIKPENLLLDEQKNLKIVDFGLSNTFKQNEKLVTACGSPCYAAPELIKGLEYVGQKADIWSAGVVLFCLVCGHLPFEDQNTQSLYQKILSASYQFTCYLSQEVRNLVQQILVPEPGLRYGLKQIKQNTWFNIYKPPVPIDKGNLNGNDSIKIHKKLLREMKERCPEIDVDYARCCLQANLKNTVTSHYHLLVKKKTLLQESMSEFSQLDVLDADADMQVAKSRKINQLNHIIPGGRQVRDHHSIPAAPRHNTGNLEHVHQARYGYQLRKMKENIANINLVNQRNIEIPFQSGNQGVVPILMADGGQLGGQARHGKTNIQAQRKNNAQIKTFGAKKQKPAAVQYKNALQNQNRTQISRKGLRSSENKNLGSSTINDQLQSLNMNDYNTQLELLARQNIEKSKNSKQQMYSTQVTADRPAAGPAQKRNQPSTMMSPNKHASRKFVRQGTRPAHNSSNKAQRQSSQVPGQSSDLPSQVNQSLTFNQRGGILGTMDLNQVNNISISQMSKMSGSQNLNLQGLDRHGKPTVTVAPGNRNLQTLQHTQKRQSALGEYQTSTLQQQPQLKQSGGRLPKSSQNRFPNDFATAQIQKKQSLPGQGQILPSNDSAAPKVADGTHGRQGSNISKSRGGEPKQKRPTYTTKSKLKKSFMEFQNEAQYINQQQNQQFNEEEHNANEREGVNKNNRQYEALQPHPASQAYAQKENQINDSDTKQQILNQMLQSSNPQQQAAPQNQQMPGSRAERISKKHIRANSSANNYTGTQLAPGGAAALRGAVAPLGAQAVGATKSTAVAPQIPMTSIDTAASRGVTRDSLNITNSLIISNSQILFQDMGNGKIIPMPLNNLGTIQPNASQQNHPQLVQQQPVMQQEADNIHHSRHQKRKTAQSTRFNTMLQDYQDSTGPTAGGMTINDHGSGNLQKINPQRMPNQRNQYRGVSMSMGVNKEQMRGNSISEANAVGPTRAIPAHPKNKSRDLQQQQSKQKNNEMLFQKKDMLGNTLTVNHQAFSTAMTSNKQQRKTQRTTSTALNATMAASGQGGSVIPVLQKGGKNSRNIVHNSAIAHNFQQQLKPQGTASKPIKGNNSGAANKQQNYMTQNVHDQLSLINQQAGFDSNPQPHANSNHRPRREAQHTSEFLHNLDSKNQAQKNIQQNINQINNKIYQMKIMGGQGEGLKQSKNSLHNQSNRGQDNNRNRASGQGLNNRKNVPTNKSVDLSHGVAKISQTVQQSKKLTSKNTKPIDYAQQRQYIRDNYLGSGGQTLQSNSNMPVGLSGATQILEPSRSMLAYQGTGNRQSNQLHHSVNFNFNPSVGAIGNTLHSTASGGDSMVRNIRMCKNKQKQYNGQQQNMHNSMDLNNY